MCNDVPKAWLGELWGEKAVWLRAGRYEAAMLPELGGNLTVFRDLERGFRFLHEPVSAQDMERMKEKPTHYGFPVLFPPNRLDEGKFPWDGAVYRFPINNSARNLHSHGFLLKERWTVQSFGVQGEDCYVSVEVKVDEHHPAYRYFPHKFTLRLTYTLSGSAGLTKKVTIWNHGIESMPCLLGFHTSINAPFAVGSKASDYRFRATIGKRVEMNDRMLPTENLLELSPFERNITEEGVYPFAERLDHHFTGDILHGPNRMELTDRNQGDTLVYELGASCKHWMIFNNQAQEGYFAQSRKPALSMRRI